LNVIFVHHFLKDKYHVTFVNHCSCSSRMIVLSLFSSRSNVCIGGLIVILSDAKRIDDDDDFRSSNNCASAFGRTIDDDFFFINNGESADFILFVIVLTCRQFL